jgi:restriction endonuclease Mrr
MSPESIYGPLADQMKLSSRQRLLKRATRDEPLWHNRVQTARKNLLEEGFMEPLQRGEWRLSPAGRAEAARQAWLKTATLDDLGL